MQENSTLSDEQQLNSPLWFGRSPDMAQNTYLKEKSQVSIAPDLAFWFPYRFCIHVRDDRYLVIAPEKPGWMTLDKNEHAFFQNLLAGRTIRHSIRLVMNDLKLSLIDTVESAYSVLNKIEKNGFLESAEKPSVISRQIIIRLSDDSIPFPYPSLKSKPETLPDSSVMKDFFSALRALRPPDAIYRVRFLGWQNHKEELLALMRESAKNGIKNILAAGSLPPLNSEIIQLTDLFEIHLNYNNRIRKSAGSLSSVVKGDSRAVLRVFLTSGNIQNISEDIYKALDKIDPEKRLPVRVSVYPPSGTNLLVCDEKSDRELYRKAGEIRDRLFEQGRLLFRADPRFYSANCCDFGRDIAIGPDGSVYACPFAESPISSLHNVSPNQILKETLDLHLEASVKNLQECASCDLRNICQGRCRLHYFKDGAIDRSASSCSNAFRDQVYDKLTDSDEIYS